MIDGRMPQVEWYRPRILAIMGQRVSCPMTTHRAMHHKADLRHLADLLHHLLRSVHRHRPTTFGAKHLRSVFGHTVELAQGAELCPGERMRAGETFLSPPHMQYPRVQVDLIPAEMYQLPHTQPMAIRQQEHRIIPDPMPPHAAGGFAQRLHFARREILTETHVGVGVRPGEGERGHPWPFPWG